MSEKIESNVNDVETQVSKLKDVISQASYFEEKYPDDESLVSVFEDIKEVLSHFNSYLSKNELPDIEIGKDFYNRIDHEYGKGDYNLELNLWATRVLPDDDEDLSNLKFFNDVSSAKKSLENILAKLSKASSDAR